MQRAVPAMRGEALFRLHYQLIRHIAGSIAGQSLRGADAEDFQQHALMRLIENDYAILEKFEGRATIQSYLSVVIGNLFADYRDHLWGKWRASADARRIGPLAERLEELLVRDALTFEEAYETLVAKDRITESRGEIERIAGQLPIRTRRRMEGDETLVTMPAIGLAADRSVTAAEQQRVADWVGAIVKRELRAAGVQDCLIFVLRNKDKRTGGEVGALLNIDSKAVYRREERVRDRLREALEAEGLDSRVALEIFDNPAVTLDWVPDFTETGHGGPSETKGGPDCPHNT